MQEMQVWSQGQEDPLKEGVTIHSRILAWRIRWIEEPGRLQSMGSQRVGHGWSDLAHTHPRRGNSSPRYNVHGRADTHRIWAVNQNLACRDFQVYSSILLWEWSGEVSIWLKQDLSQPGKEGRQGLGRPALDKKLNSGQGSGFNRVKNPIENQSRLLARPGTDGGGKQRGYCWVGHPMPRSTGPLRIPWASTDEEKVTF